MKSFDMAASDKIGSWDSRKYKLKEIYPYLTESDLELDEVNRNEMFGNLKIKLNKTSDELHAIIIAL